MSAFQDLMARAGRLADARDWDGAGAAYAEAAEAASGAGEGARAQAAWSAAGEAWRRADRLDAAVRSLSRAVDLAEEPSSRLVARVKLAGSLGEMGELTTARAVCEEALRTAGDSPAKGLVFDTLVGHLMTTGGKARCRGYVDELLRSGGPMAIAGHFRAAQLARLDGVFDQAEAHLRAALAALAGHPGAQSGVAAAQAERAENALLRGEHARAVAYLAMARDGQQEAGRESLRWRAEAARARVHAAAGIPTLAHALDPGVRFAEERGMPLLEADLRLARALAASEEPHAADEDLRKAVTLADEAGCRLRSGRIRLAWVELAGIRGERAHRVLMSASEHLADSRPWSARAWAARGWNRLEVDPEESRTLLARARLAFDEMGMMRDLERLDERMRRTP